MSHVLVGLPVAGLPRSALLPVARPARDPIHADTVIRPITALAGGQIAWRGSGIELFADLVPDRRHGLAATSTVCTHVAVTRVGAHSSRASPLMLHRGGA